MDLVICAVILLVASGAFYLAVQDIVKNTTLQSNILIQARKDPPPAPVVPPVPVESESISSKILPSPCTVECKQAPLPIPRVYIDYGLQRQLFDNPAPLDFEILDGDHVEVKESHDDIYRPTYSSLAAIGVDDESGQYIFMQSALSTSDPMRPSPIEDTFLLFEGPDPVSTPNSVKSSSYIDDSDPAPTMKAFTLAKQAGKGIFELRRNIGAAEPDANVSI